MPSAPSASSSSSSTARDVIALAEKTHTPVALVKTLYDREVAALEAQARIKNFIAVLASKRVKRDLKALEASGHQAASLKPGNEPRGEEMEHPPSGREGAGSLSAPSSKTAFVA